MLALTLDSTSLMLIRHDCDVKDSLGGGTRAWNFLKERFRSQDSPIVMALVSQIARTQLKPDEALHGYFNRAQKLTTRLSDAGERIPVTIFMALILEGQHQLFYWTKRSTQTTSKKWYLILASYFPPRLLGGRNLVRGENKI